MLLPSTPATTSQLSLDPGPQPRRRTKIRCRCILWTLVALVFITGSYLTFFIVRTAVRMVTTPHRHLYQDINGSYTPNEIVRPLVDSNQTFDIVATVWLRQNELEADAVSGLAEGAEAQSQSPPRLVERPIFSDTVFRDLRLGNKIVRSAVNLSISTEIFKNAELWNYDLRASFVLVPRPPSPLMHAVNYSTWIPQRAHMPPMRPSYADEDRQVADAIVDSYGILVPLLEFHPIPSRCDNEQPGSADDDDIDDNWHTPSSSQPEVPSPLHPYRSTKGRSMLQAHPYIITRTHIRVVDMTTVLNRKAYDLEHKRLSSKACRPEKFAKPPSWVECSKLYGVNGNMETRIKLQTVDERTGANVTEWAYGPYLDYYYNANGPLDPKPVPIFREQCSDSSKASSSSTHDQDVMNVLWNIAFSAKSPGKLVTQSTFAISALPVHEGRNMSATDYEMYVNHNKHAYINGLFGHSSDDGAHPRLHAALSSMLFLSYIMQYILEFLYWYSRSSTVGISITGTTMYVFGSFMQYILEVVQDGYGTQVTLVGWIITAVFRVEFIFSLSTIWMLKTITRAELRWKSSTSWVPVFHIAGATHAERASRRVDELTPPRHILTAYAVLAAIFFTFYHFDIYIISSPGIMGPPPDTKAITISVLSKLFIQPAATLGKILQLIINFRKQQFAGAYKMQALLFCLAAGCMVVIEAPNLFGNSNLKEGLPLDTVVNFILLAMLSWQAVVYPPVLQEEEAED